MKIKTIETNGITYIESVPGATSEWYCSLDYEHGDLYEAEELFNNDYSKLDWEWSMFDPEQKNKWPSEEFMKKLAMENNLSETAFIVKEEQGYHLRWFTPGSEVELCGHATLASSGTALIKVVDL